MIKEHFKNELQYQSMLAVTKQLLKKAYLQSASF